MPKGKKARTHVEMDGKASSKARAELQNARHKFNVDIRLGLVYGTDLTPWEASKAKRRLTRARAGKNFKNWAKQDAKAQSAASPVNAGTLSK